MSNYLEELPRLQGDLKVCLKFRYLRPHLVGSLIPSGLGKVLKGDVMINNIGGTFLCQS